MKASVPMFLVATRAVAGSLILGGEPADGETGDPIQPPADGCATYVELFGELAVGQDVVFQIARQWSLRVGIYELGAVLLEGHDVLQVEVPGRIPLRGVSQAPECLVIDGPRRVAGGRARVRRIRRERAIVVVAEGAKHNADALAKHFTEHAERLNFELRVTKLGHVQRGGAPGAFDRLGATLLGAEAIERWCAGEHGILLGLSGDRLTVSLLREAVARPKPLQPQWLHLAHVLSR